MNRKDFLKHTALVSASLMMPRFLQASRWLGNSGAAEGKVLVVIQFSGGNDGLNTVVPFRDDTYHSLRPGLGLKKDELHLLDDQQGLNPNMTGLKALYDDGALSIINSVGYPNPNRSHFRSMDIWQTGSSRDQHWHTGWLGRMLDANCPDCDQPYMAIEADDTLSLALKGNVVNGLAISNPQQFYRNTHEPFFFAVSQQKKKDSPDHPNLDFLHKTLTATTNSAEYVFEKSKVYKTQTAYPMTKLGKNLKMVASLIIAGSATKVYYVSLPGFDTHVNQKGPQSRLLKQYSDAVAAFTEDLKQNNRFKDTLIMTFSEFGRRVKQNASGGTDHGTANNLFLISGSLKMPGILNAPPDLQDLDNGDLKYTVDFREVYATILDKWMGAKADKILRAKFKRLNFI